jgi:type II secretory ATPase GspE/PulE/Tfp pilus assembly ATPase PilB-like protein
MSIVVSHPDVEFDTGMGASIDIPAFTDSLIRTAIERRASDIHVEPEADDAAIKLRIDGVLIELTRTPPDVGRAVVNRLMVMAQLLTYRLDIPQEGRATVEMGAEAGGQKIDLRIAIMPTTRGLRAAVRLPAELVQPRTIEALALDDTTLSLVDTFCHADAGALLIVGPAGSGKTTTAYAILEAIRDRTPGVSIVTLEDPVERQLHGITQIAVTPMGQLTYATALRSMLRQDPQVLMLGEIRDAETAAIAMQAALSGHRMLCTFHAADPARAMVRLLEMGIEPYQLTSSLHGVIAMRLLRRTYSGGYAGRVPVCEPVRLDAALSRLLTSHRPDAESLRACYIHQPKYQSLRAAAQDRVSQGITDEAEVRRVLGEDV